MTTNGSEYRDAANDIDQMSGDELRDALAAVNWGMEGHLWIHKTSAGPSYNAHEGEHPIPALDTPEALGVIVKMIPEGWQWVCGMTRDTDGRGDLRAYAWLRWGTDPHVDGTPMARPESTATMELARALLKVIKAGGGG